MTGKEKTVEMPFLWKTFFKKHGESLHTKTWITLAPRRVSHITTVSAATSHNYFGEFFFLTP
jgi:hypothetical protein